MDLVVDLHSHSPYAGASGKVDFERLRFCYGGKGNRYIWKRRYSS